MAIEYMTQSGYDKLKKELADALAQRPVISAAIAEAREKGEDYTPHRINHFRLDRAFDEAAEIDMSEVTPGNTERVYADQPIPEREA